MPAATLDAVADRLDPDTRRRVTSAGGHGRAVKLTPEQRAASAAAAARAMHSPASLANRIVRAWPDLSRAERAEVRQILATIMQGEARPRTLGSLLTALVIIASYMLTPVGVHHAAAEQPHVPERV